MRSFELALERGEQPDHSSMIALANAYADAVSWLEDLADHQEITDHTDTFFANEIVLRLAESLREVQAALLESAAEGVVLHPQMFRRLYRRLVWTFSVRISSFERKRYVSLSHEPNKAMNLNSYMGLMGGTYREIQTVGGTALVPALPGEGLEIPDPDYVVTLDADSVLLPEYCLRLVHLLEQQEYQDTAIAQTPYSAFPGSATRLERIAGATTDLQHIVHQGLTYYDATFWVGANAVIRKKALDQIAETSYIGDWEIKQYIKDRTVIEDTESTIDMGIHGWRLFNYPERLSYSATPPDFGSLCIQRRRWANGGLLILAKLHRQSRVRRAEGNRIRLSELFLRWNYMASISWSSASLLILLAFPFSATLISPLLGLIALPYFVAMASDLRYCGYKRLDVLRIYGFNLILLGVNLAGTLSSIVQGITASKAPFARTPKVRNRTVVAPFLLIAPYLLIGLAGYTFYRAYVNHLRENMFYAALNVVLACYAVMAFIGLRNSLVDLWIHGTALLYRSAERRRRLSTLLKRPAGGAAHGQLAGRASGGLRRAAVHGDGRPGVSGLAVGARACRACQRHRPRRSSAAVAGSRAPAVVPRPPSPVPRRRQSPRCPRARPSAGCPWCACSSPSSSLPGPATACTRASRRGCSPPSPLPTRPGSRPTSTSRSPRRTSSRARRPTRPGRASSASWSPPRARTAPRAGEAPTRWRRPTRPLAVGARIAQLQQEGAQAIVSLRRPGQHQPGRRLPDRRRPDLRLPVGDQRLPAHHDRPGHRGGRAGQRRRRESPRPGDRQPGAVRSQAQGVAHPPGRTGRAAGQRPVGDQLDAARPRVDRRRQRHDDGLQLAPGCGEHDGAVGRGRAERDLRAARQPVPAVRHPPARAADLAGTRRDGDDRPERHPGRELHRDRREDPGQLRRSQPPRPDLHVVDQPGQPVRLVLPGDRAALQHLQRHRAVRPPVRPDLRPAAGQRRRHADRGQGAARRAGHQPGRRALPAVVGQRRVPARLQGRRERPDLPGQVVQQRRRPVGAGAELADPWELVGPVVPGDHGPTIPTLPAGTYPAWSLSTQYQVGEKVLFQGLPYQAKWSNQGVSPATQSTDPSGSPWKALYTIPGEPAARRPWVKSARRRPPPSASALGSVDAIAPKRSLSATPSTRSAVCRLRHRHRLSGSVA